MTANLRQVGGEHYRSEYQHWDWARDIGLNPMQYQVSKYVSRSRKKNGLQDLEKALHFAEKELENMVVTQDKIDTLTAEYIQANDFTIEEKSVIRRVALTIMPDVELMEDVVLQLRSMVQMQKGAG